LGSRERRVFRVTHPFHPLFGQEFELLDIRSVWGEWRVYYGGEDGSLRRLPLSWTDAGAEDPFLAFSDGRSLFRVDDLVRLTGLVDQLTKGGPV
jgi:hypothetical protein